MNENFRIGHLQAEMPWGNAGGICRSIDDVRRMAHTSVGLIEDGSHTLEERIEKIVEGQANYHYDPETGESFNAHKMPNRGLGALVESIPEKIEIADEHEKTLIFNVAPVGEDPVTESQELVESVFTAIRKVRSRSSHGVLLNAACPTVKEDEAQILSRDPELLGKVLLGLRGVTEQFDPVLVRIAPQPSYSDMRSLLRRVPRGVVSAISLNSFPASMRSNNPDNPVLQIDGGIAGKSGRAMSQEARRQLAWGLAAGRIGGRNIAFLSSVGIEDGQELSHRISMGACGGLSSTFFIKPDTVERGWGDASYRFTEDFLATEDGETTRASAQDVR